MQTQHIEKNDHNIQSQHLKTVFQNIHNKNEYKDPQFTHTYDKIYPKQVNITKMHHVIWTPCQQLHHHPYYSNGDFTLKELKQFNFITKKISTALIIMKYFIPQSFHKLTKGRQLYYQHQNKRIKHLFVFDVYLSKQHKKVMIDSYVPVLQVKNRELFAQNRRGCVFGCLVEKLLAKMCDGYDQVRRLQVCEMLQMLTGCYVREQRSLKQHQQWVNNNKIGKKNERSIKNERDTMIKISQQIDKKINVQKSLLFFRTRNNKQLIPFGLKPNCLYFIMKVSNNNQNSLNRVEQQKNGLNRVEQQKNGVITFLQYPCGGQQQQQQTNDDGRIITSQQQQQQQCQLRWIGNHSRYRLDARNILESMKSKSQQRQRQGQKQRIRYRELQQDMNFISMKDMLQVSQSIVILHNVDGYHQQNHQFLLSKKRVLPQYLSIYTNQGLSLNSQGMKDIVNSRRELRLDQFGNINTRLLNVDLGKQQSPLVVVRNKLLYTFQECLYIKVARSIKTNNEQRATNIINNKNFNVNKMYLNFRVILQQSQLTFNNMNNNNTSTYNNNNNSTIQQYINHNRFNLHILIWSNSNKRVICNKNIVNKKLTHMNGELYYDVLVQIQQKDYLNQIDQSKSNNDDSMMMAAQTYLDWCINNKDMHNNNKSVQKRVRLKVSDYQYKQRGDIHNIHNVQIYSNTTKANNININININNNINNNNNNINNNNINNNINNNNNNINNNNINNNNNNNNNNINNNNINNNNNNNNINNNNINNNINNNNISINNNGYNMTAESYPHLSAFQQQQKPIYQIIKHLIKSQRKQPQQSPQLLIKSSQKQHLIKSPIQIYCKSPIQIYCKQFIAQLNMGVIWIKLTNFVSKLNNQSLLVHKNLSSIANIQVDHQILIQNGIYLYDVKGVVVKQWMQILRQEEKQKNINNSSSVQKQKQKQKWRVQLNGQNPQIIILFKIYTNSYIKQQTNETKQYKIPFPPLGSVKINRVIDINV